MLDFIKREKIIIYLSIILVILFNYTITDANNKKVDDTIIKYDIFSHRKKIGTSVNLRKKSLKDNQQTVISRSNSVINVSYLLFNFQIWTKDLTITKNNTLHFYEATFKENQDRSKFTISKDKNNYLARFESDDEVTKKKLKIESFDFLSSQLPYTIDRENQRQLNIETGQVVPAVIKKLNKERITINNQTFDCSVISLKTKKREAKLWIAKDDTGFFLVKEQGSDKDGPYKILIDNYRKIQG